MVHSNTMRAAAFVLSVVLLALPLQTRAGIFFDPGTTDFDDTVREEIRQALLLAEEIVGRTVSQFRLPLTGGVGVRPFDSYRAPTVRGGEPFDPGGVSFPGRAAQHPTNVTTDPQTSTYGRRAAAPRIASVSESGDSTATAGQKSVQPPRVDFGLRRLLDLIPLFQRLADQPKLGTPCGAGPGDPWWASDCSCRCGQPCPEDPEIPCEVCKQIRIGTRHHPLTIAECRADFLHPFADPAGGDPTAGFHL